MEVVLVKWSAYLEIYVKEYDERGGDLHKTTGEKCNKLGVLSMLIMKKILFHLIFAITIS